MMRNRRIITRSVYIQYLRRQTKYNRRKTYNKKNTTNSNTKKTERV